MRLSITSILPRLVFLCHYAFGYLDPAPVDVIQPDPTSYQNWLPLNLGHEDFTARNTSVQPWNVDPSSTIGNVKISTQSGACGIQSPSPQSSFWMSKFKGVQQGTSPFLANGSNYQVYRNVKDFGAVGDGKHDDTVAFNNAIKYGGRVSGGLGPGGTTGQPALIYVPAGTYLISSTIQFFINTQLIGDALNFPTIKASPNLKPGSVVISGFDPGQGSTTNFFLGLRNLNIDTTSVAVTKQVYALNWAVSQGTSLFNINFRLAPKSSHIGLEMNGGTSGGGSGTMMGDLTFSGGLIGILFNNQQYAIKNVSFSNVATAIAVQHAFVLALQQISCVNVGICLDAGAQDVAGSISLVDSSCDTCGTVVNGTSSIVLENVKVRSSGPTLRVGGVDAKIGDLAGKTYVRGSVYQRNGERVDSPGRFLPYTKRGTLTAGDGRYFVKAQPQYTDFPLGAFSSVKDFGAKGDGRTDDTAAIRAALLANANCGILYFPHGVYVVTDTVYVPPGSRLVGEVWSVISASGAKFKSAAAPRAMLQVGKPGEVGVVEFSDLLFTVADVLPGAILVEVNMRGAKQGDVSFHNCHYRIGGAADSKTETACQVTSQPCKAAFLVLWLGKTSSSYIENAWLWSADHDLDGKYNQQIGTGRGMLIEATAGTWLVGTGSEHHTLYAYQFVNAANVMAAMQQVETPYWQPSPRAPAPWTPNSTWLDPSFSGSNPNVAQNYMQWTLRIIGGHTLNLYGQGCWVFFNGPNYGACKGPGGACQVNIVDLQGLNSGDGVELFNLNTRGVQNMIIAGGAGGVVQATQAANPGSWGGLITTFLKYA